MKLLDRWLELDEVSSTQEVVAGLLQMPQHAPRLRRTTAEIPSEASTGGPIEAPDLPGVVFAHHQAAGKGRFDRVWVSERGDSVTLSLIFSDYAGHAKPWVIGMSVAVAAATVIGCSLRWPNDLAFGEKKVAGQVPSAVLMEIVLLVTHALRDAVLRRR